MSSSKSSAELRATGVGGGEMVFLHCPQRAGSDRRAGGTRFCAWQEGHPIIMADYEQLSVRRRGSQVSRRAIRGSMLVFPTVGGPPGDRGSVHNVRKAENEP